MQVDTPGQKNPDNLLLSRLGKTEKSALIEKFGVETATVVAAGFFTSEDNEFRRMVSNSKIVSKSTINSWMAQQRKTMPSWMSYIATPSKQRSFFKRMRLPYPLIDRPRQNFVVWSVWEVCLFSLGDPGFVSSDDFTASIRVHGLTLSDIVARNLNFNSKTSFIRDASNLNVSPYFNFKGKDIWHRDDVERVASICAPNLFAKAKQDFEAEKSSLSHVDDCMHGYIFKGEHAVNLHRRLHQVLVEKKSREGTVLDCDFFNMFDHMNLEKTLYAGWQAPSTVQEAKISPKIFQWLSPSKCFFQSPRPFKLGL